MVDFKQLKADRSKPAIVEPSEIFRRLPKPPGINDLYTSQSEVLRQWYDRRSDKDLVIKLHTGGGKTLVGLLIAQSSMNETGSPTIYLCPTNQLVEQTLQKAREYGIPACQYIKRQPFPKDFTSARSVFVCTYNALFNAKSKFGTRGGSSEIVKAGCIVLDDAHIAYSTMRSAFTLSVSKEASPEDYHHLVSLFRQDFIDNGKIGTFDDIISGLDFAVLEVPYWSWQEKSAQVRDYLQKKAEEYPMEWSFIRDEFDYCHCLIGREAFSITPLFPTVDFVPTFSEAPRRVYMSATISDDSMIVRTFDADANTLSKPLISNSLAGVSERMILAPGLMPKGVSDEKQLVQRITKWMVADQNRATVVLTPSKRKASDWAAVGTIAETADMVTEFVKNLQEGRAKGPFIFFNRYDGIDLPSEACRLLVMAGLPLGANDYDMFRSAVFLGGTEFRSSLAQRIEQGVGRGARGGGDFCVVILTGHDLIAWIDSPANRKFLTSSTQAQLSIGSDVSCKIESETEFGQTILRCISRDPEWMSYHAETLGELVKPATTDSNQLRFASLERKAFGLFRKNSFDSAIKKITQYVSSEPEGLDSQAKGWLLQLAARIGFYSGNAELAREHQTNAFFANNNVHRPLNDNRYLPLQTPQAQAKSIVERARKFYSKRGSLAEFDSIVSLLVPTSTSNQFEFALESLGKMLGFSTERPDNKYGVGPDVLWLLDESTALVIEAKSRKLPKNPLTKEEHGQLLNAEEWFKSQYEGYKAVRVSMHPNRLVSFEAITNDTKVLTFEKLASLTTAARKLLEALDEPTLKDEQLEVMCEEALNRLNLTPDGIQEHFLESFEPYTSGLEVE